MRKILLLLFLVLSSAVAEASECGCDPSADLRIRQLIEADVIFKGQVITKRTVYFPDIGYRYVATFRIEELISGNSMSDTLEIEFGYDGDYCSVYFQPLVSYFIAASKDEEFPYFQTNYCSENRKWENLSKGDHRLLVDFQKGKSDSNCFQLLKITNSTNSSASRPASAAWVQNFPGSNCPYTPGKSPKPEQIAIEDGC
jgi:hypothetical protein